jgi:hypothetical protein
MPGHDPAEEYDDDRGEDAAPAAAEDTVPLPTLPDPPSLDEIELRPPRGVALSASRSYRGVVMKTLLFATLLVAVVAVLAWRADGRLPTGLAELRALWPFSLASSEGAPSVPAGEQDRPLSPIVDEAESSAPSGEAAAGPPTEQTAAAEAGGRPEARQPVEASSPEDEDGAATGEPELDLAETTPPEEPRVPSAATGVEQERVTATVPAASTGTSETPALLTIRQYPGTPQAWVEANGRELGITPIERISLPAGTYEVTLWEHPEHRGRRLEKRLGLAPGSSAVVSFDLTDPDRLVLRQNPPPGS